MSKVVEELKPKEWTSDEAYHSGQTAYRIGVLLSGNPFKNGALPLGDKWIEGWNYAQENDPYPKQKKVIYAEERPDDRRPRSRDHARDSFSRSSSSGGRRR